MSCGREGRKGALARCRSRAIPFDTPADLDAGVVARLYGSLVRGLEPEHVLLEAVDDRVELVDRADLWSKEGA